MKPNEVTQTVSPCLRLAVLYGYFRANCCQRDDSNSPTPLTTQSRRIALGRLWEALPEETRQRTLKTLSRILTQQLLPPLDEKEVDQEDC